MPGQKAPYGHEMRLPFIAGLGLLLGAALAGAFEPLARGQSGSESMILSAHDIWYTLWPGNLVVTQTLVERHVGAGLWEYVIGPALRAPAWLLLGVPGAALTWFFRPFRNLVPDAEEASMFLFDSLAKAAKEEGYAEGQDDMLPDHGPDLGYDLEDELDLPGLGALPAPEEEEKD